jgi:hypothetical protein
LFAYRESNHGSTIAYGKHYREHKPISTAMAESAVNQVVNARKCKCQHMRWTPRGAHLLAQVRCAVINGDLATKLAAYGARIDEVPGDVSRFLEFLQRAAEAEPHARADYNASRRRDHDCRKWCRRVERRHGVAAAVIGVDVLVVRGGNGYKSRSDKRRPPSRNTPSCWQKLRRIMPVSAPSL